MEVKFHVLASGSSGNASVLHAGGFGILIDFGLSPRLLAPRLERCGITWDHIHAVLLTHTHTDHFQTSALAQLVKLEAPIYCHEEHLRNIDQGNRAFQTLMSAGRIRCYEPGEPLVLQPGVRCVPITVAHDATHTCGFRIDGGGWSVGYATDFGSWTPALAKRFADVDLLALEFNHDVELQLTSGRSPFLIRRVLGNRGHLSNEQAAAFVQAILRCSLPGRLRHLIQLHLSRDCNTPELANLAAQKIVDCLGIELAIHTSHQDQDGATIAMSARKTARWTAHSEVANCVQPLLAFPE